METNIQDKIQEIHHKFGVTEKSNYEIQLFVEDLIKKDRAEQLILQRVSKRSICGCGNPKVEHSCKNCKGQIKHS